MGELLNRYLAEQAAKRDEEKLAALGVPAKLKPEQKNVPAEKEEKPAVKPPPSKSSGKGK